jgi:secondary thiamine-phosphate synthase enzyme
VEAAVPWSSDRREVVERSTGACFGVWHARLRVQTEQPFQLVDITPSIESFVTSVGLDDGVVHVHTRHTTTGILVNEHEPLLFEDLRRMFDRLAPASAQYAHDDLTRRTVNLVPNERHNGHAHCRAALLRASESVPVEDGALALGRWQRVFFVECDGPQSRQIALTLIGRRQ